VGKYRPLVGGHPGLIGRSCRCAIRPACSTAPAVAVRWWFVRAATGAIVTARDVPRWRDRTLGASPGSVTSTAAGAAWPMRSGSVATGPGVKKW